MFIGHYAVGLALKSADRKVSLGLLFLAVQFVDILFFPFVLAGIERLNIIENFTESTHFELAFMPYTHSLVGSIIIATTVFLAFRFILPKKVVGGKNVAYVMGVAVLSHWILDLFVHTPDLPLFRDDSIKVGFGLWNNAVATYLVEAILLLVGLYLYLRATKSTTFWGKFGMAILCIIMLVININNLFGPPFGDNIVTLSVSALGMYFAFAGAAFWLDRQRRSVSFTNDIDKR